MNRCNCVLSALNETAGKEYKSPTKISSVSKADEMRRLYSDCRQGELYFEEIASTLASDNNKICVFHRNLLDGSRRRIRNYYWVEFIDESYLSSPESISLFAEKDTENDLVRFRVSTEINEKRASGNSLKKHNELVNYSPVEGSLFALNSSLANRIEFVEKSSEAKRLLKEGAGKVQMCFVFLEDDKMTEDETIKQLSNAIKKLQSVYEKIVKQD